MKKCVVGVYLLIALPPSALMAEKYAGEFMALGGGARAMAMGGAFAAIANDATATFWNPAGIADFASLQAGPGDWELSLMNSERFGILLSASDMESVTLNVMISSFLPWAIGNSLWSAAALPPRIARASLRTPHTVLQSNIRCQMESR